MPLDASLADTLVAVREQLTMIVTAVLTFVQANQAYAPFIVFVLAFVESIVFLSLVIPSSAIFLGVGALIGAADLAFWPIWAGVTLGGILGDWVSYWLGTLFGHRARAMWPLKNSPELTERAGDLIQRRGAWAVFLGRFISPIRSFVPFIAGMFDMRMIPFQTANVTSAIVWATVLLAPGAALLRGYVG
jgi:membrane protein DedA with SNARE-associated domain